MNYVKLLLIANFLSTNLHTAFTPKTTAERAECKFEPVVGNGIHDMESCSSRSYADTPVDQFAMLTAYLPPHIKTMAWTHFEQTNNLLKSKISIEEATNLATLYLKQWEREIEDAKK
jgi:hypothetical protein